MNLQACQNEPKQGQPHPDRKGAYSGGRTILGILVVNVLVAGTAFFKDVYLAAYLGTSSTADAFNFAYFVPDSIASGVLAAALGVSCVPVFSRQFALFGAVGLHRMVTRIAWRSALGSAIVTVVCLCFGQVLFGRLVGTPELAQQAWPLFAVMAPTIILYPLVAVYSAALQTKGRFITSVAPPLVLNIVVLGIALALLTVHRAPVFGSRLISWFVLLGVAGMVAVVWVAWLRHRRSVAEEPELTGTIAQERRHSPDRQLWTMFSWYLMYVAATQCIGFVERGMAARQPTGTIAGLTYAYRIASFPVWVYVAALGTFILPAMSRGLALGQTAAVQHSLLRALKYCAMVCFPTMLLFYTMRVPLTEGLLGHGAFGAHSVAVTADLLSTYVWMILGQAVLLVCLRYFLAAGVLSWPVLASLLSAVLNIVLDACLVPHFGGLALGVGASAGSTCNALLLLWLAGRRLEIRWRSCLQPCVRLLYANAVLAGFIALARVAYNQVSPQGHLETLGATACMVAVLAGIYGVLLYQFRLVHWRLGEVTA